MQLSTVHLWDHKKSPLLQNCMKCHKVATLRLICAILAMRMRKIACNMCADCGKLLATFP